MLLLGPNGHPAAGWPQDLPSHAQVSWLAPTADGGVAVMGQAVTITDRIDQVATHPTWSHAMSSTRSRNGSAPSAG